MSARIRASALVVLVVLPASGCFLISEDDIADRLDGTAAEVYASSEAAVGVAVRLPNGAPVPAATVVVGGASARTDDAGLASFDVVGNSRTVIGAGVPGLTTWAWTAIDPPGGSTAGASLVVHPLERHPVHRADHGAAVGAVDDHAVVLGPLRDAEGLPASGYAEVGMRRFHPGEPGVPPRGSWDLLAVVYVDGVDGTSAGSWPVEPATLRVRTTVYDAVRTATDPRALWFDPEAGIWVDVGEVALEPNYATASFDAPGWWALAAADELLGCVKGRVDAPGAFVSIGAPDLLGAVQVTADGSGAFEAMLPAGLAGDATVWGFGATGAALITTAVALPPSESGGCADAGQLQIERSRDDDADGYFAGPGGDCDDDDALVRPGATDEPDDGADTNCDGVDGRDSDRDGFPAGEGPAADCDDTAAHIHPGAVEVCDGADGDCNGLRDDGVAGAVDDPAGTGCVPCTSGSTFELNPILYWTLDDVGTTWAVDSSGHGRDASIEQLFEQYPGVTHDAHTTPMWLGSKDDYVRLAPVNGWPRDEMSLSMFFRTYRRGRTLISYSWTDGLGLEHDNEFMVMLRPVVTGIEEGLYVDVHETRVLVPVTDFDPTVGDWHHLVTTWRTEGQVQVYLDGVLVWSAELTESDPLSETYGEPVQVAMEDGGALYLGQEQNCHDGCVGSIKAWDGLIDEVAIFDRVLTVDEVDRIFGTVTCGEGLRCDRMDNDEDGTVDEHLFGSDSCPADDCLHIAETDSSLGDRWYTVHPLGFPAPVDAYCDMTNGATTHFCGDGEVFAPYETCDETSLACTGCAIRVMEARDCQEVLALGYLADGPYVVDLNGKGVETLVRCDQTSDGGGWTLFYNHDISDKQLFPCESDALSFNVNQPFSSRYTLLGAMPHLDRGFGWQLRMAWPQALAPKVNWWQQSSDPAQEAIITDYIPCDVEATQHGFAGLYRIEDAGIDACCPFPQLDPLTTCPSMLIRGGDTVEPWYVVGQMAPISELDYALPATQDLGGDGSTPQVQLWVRSAGEAACSL